MAAISREFSNISITHFNSGSRRFVLFKNKGDIAGMRPLDAIILQARLQEKGINYSIPPFYSFKKAIDYIRNPGVNGLLGIRSPFATNMLVAFREKGVAPEMERKYPTYGFYMYIDPQLREIYGASLDILKNEMGFEVKQNTHSMYMITAPKRDVHFRFPAGSEGRGMAVSEISGHEVSVGMHGKEIVVAPSSFETPNFNFSENMGSIKLRFEIKGNAVEFAPFKDGGALADGIVGFLAYKVDSEGSLSYELVRASTAPIRTGVLYEEMTA